MQKEFLQSNEWRKFQEAFGRRTFCVSNDEFSASIIEHNLPIVGNYFYIPKGPIMKGTGSLPRHQAGRIESGMTSLLNLAEKE